MNIYSFIYYMFIKCVLNSKDCFRCWGYNGEQSRHIPSIVELRY